MWPRKGRYICYSKCLSEINQTACLFPLKTPVVSQSIPKLFISVLIPDDSLFLFYVNWCSASVYVHVTVSDPLELELQDSCKLPCGCREMNPGSLEE